MTKPGRIPCINPRCNRTADATKYPNTTAIICQKCWKLLPSEMRQKEKRTKSIIRKLERRGRNASAIRMRNWQVWDDIWDYFNKPKEPEGLDNFLKEIGLDG